MGEFGQVSVGEGTGVDRAVNVGIVKELRKAREKRLEKKGLEVIYTERNTKNIRVRQGLTYRDFLLFPV